MVVIPYISLSTASTALAMADRNGGFGFRINSIAHFALTIPLDASQVWGSGRSNKPVSQYEVTDKRDVPHRGIYGPSFSTASSV
jgi:hypothetical protein